MHLKIAVFPISSHSTTTYSQLMNFLSFGGSAFPTTDIDRPYYVCFDEKLKV